MLHTTFTLLRKAQACSGRYRHFAKAVGGVKVYGAQTPIPLTLILERNGLDDALWCLRCVLPEEVEERDKQARLLACDYAERTLHLFGAQFPQDARPRQAIETARRFTNGEAALAEMDAARDAAWDAARDSAGDAAWVARNAAWVARNAAGDAALAAWAAAWVVARATGAAAWVSARAGAIEREWQAQRFRELLEAGGDKAPA